MSTGYFVAEGFFRRPFFDVEVSFPDAGNRSIRVAFEVDTGADRTLLPPFDGQRMLNQLGIDIRSVQRGEPIVGVGGNVQTRIVRATLSIGNYMTTMPLPIVDLPPGPSGMPSLIGRDIIYDFVLFMEHRTDRLLLLRDAAEFSLILDS